MTCEGLNCESLPNVPRQAGFLPQISLKTSGAVAASRPRLSATSTHRNWSLAAHREEDSSGKSEVEDFSSEAFLRVLDQRGTMTRHEKEGGEVTHVHGSRAEVLGQAPAK